MTRVNPCHAEFILGNIIKKYLYFPSFFNTKMAQVFKILPFGTRACVSCIFNSMAADVLGRQGAINIESLIFKWQIKKGLRTFLFWILRVSLKWLTCCVFSGEGRDAQCDVAGRRSRGNHGRNGSGTGCVSICHHHIQSGQNLLVLWLYYCKTSKIFTDNGSINHNISLK